MKTLKKLSLSVLVIAGLTLATACVQPRDCWDYEVCEDLQYPYETLDRNRMYLLNVEV